MIGIDELERAGRDVQSVVTERDEYDTYDLAGVDFSAVFAMAERYAAAYGETLVERTEAAVDAGQERSAAIGDQTVNTLVAIWISGVTIGVRAARGECGE